MALTVGMIGLGLMGERMLRTLANDERYELGPLFDVDPARVERAVGAFGGRAAQSAEATWEDSVDLVYIATPPATHVRYGRAATEAGRAVFCEKPLAVDVEEAARWVADVEKSNARASIHFPFATLPGLLTVEDRIASGSLGALESLEIRLRFSQWPRTWHHAGEWLSGRVEGGFTREVFSHFAYLTQRLVGPLELQSSTVEYLAAQETEHRVDASFTVGELPVRLLGTVESGMEDYCGWTLTGFRAAVRLADWREWSWSDGGEFVAVDDTFLQPHVTLPDALARFLCDESHPLPDLRTGLGVQRVVEGILAGDAAR